MKFLLVKLNHLGDTLLLTPTLRLLRERHPEARIDVIVRGGCETMLKGNPDITNLIGVARPEKENRSAFTGAKEFLQAARLVAAQRYDYAFDLSDSDRAKTFIALSGAKVRGINDAYDTLKRKAIWPRVFNGISKFDWAPEHQVWRDFRTVTDVMKIQAEAGPLRFHPQVDESALFNKLPFLKERRPFAILHPTSRWGFKQWLPERWAQVADAIQKKHGLAVLLSTGPDAKEHEYVQHIKAAAKSPLLWNEGKTSLHELGWMLQNARLFLGVDTVAMHLAAAMQTPIVALFGPSSEWSWHPWKVRHELVLGPCNCKKTREFICDKSRIYPCMESISVDSVLVAADKLLTNK